jgi:hypothetical protein
MRPSWERWPPNCCEICVGPWVRKGEHWGICGKSDSLEFGTSTDTRFRCPAFERRPEPSRTEVARALLRCRQSCDNLNSQLNPQQRA